MKVLGIDYGDKTIGLAILDMDVDFIYPYKTLYRNKANVLRKSLRDICDIIKYENIKKVVLGLPLNMDGKEGERVLLVKNFANCLCKRIDKNIDLIFEDERLTTMEAISILKNNNIKREDYKKYIDQISAVKILESYKNNLNKND